MKTMRFFKAFMMAATVVATMSMVGCKDDPKPEPEYTVAVTATTGGTATASATKATAGTTVTLTATPAEGYVFSKWTVENGGASLGSATTASTTFSMPKANVSVKAEFTQGQAPVDPTVYWEGSDLKTTADKKITGSISLKSDVVYNLSGPLLVEEGGELTIPAGTRIEGTNPDPFQSYILVLQGGKIYVKGTAADPVVMTAPGTDVKAGSWGGLIINGKAPLSGGGVYTTEINPDFEYGGNSATDSSGSIEYLILRGTGAKNNANTEHNGLTLNGVGNGTKIENIYVVDGADDGIEFFGGSVNVTNLLVVNSDDDMFDFTFGYNGTLKNAYGLLEDGFSSEETDISGVEADGNLDGKLPDQAGQSNFKIEDVTFDLRFEYNTHIVETENGKEYNPMYEMQNVLRIRRGATATITNALVTGTGRSQYLVRVADSAGNGNAATSVSLTNALTGEVGVEFDPADKLADYPNIDFEVEGNSGASTEEFAWTKYEF